MTPDPAGGPQITLAGDRKERAERKVSAAHLEEPSSRLEVGELFHSEWEAAGHRGLRLQLHEALEGRGGRKAQGGGRGCITSLYCGNQHDTCAE